MGEPADDLRSSRIGDYLHIPDHSDLRGFSYRAPLPNWKPEPLPERAMSPSWVAETTEDSARELAWDPGEDPDPNWDRVIREKETDRISHYHRLFWPG
ncbi:MAG TPA: hypothetical protein VIH99_04215 [Bdellovibrionota bacterium]|jgi:hypothetical protein